MSGLIYIGWERRGQCVYRTQHTEFFFQGPICVRVRERQSGNDLPRHMAVKQHLKKALHYAEDGRLLSAHDTPRVGDCLYFLNEDRELITGAIETIEHMAGETKLQSLPAVSKIA